MEFNINDYSHQESVDNFTPKTVEYVDFGKKDLSRYSEGSIFSFKDKPDLNGEIRRVEDGNVVFNMFDRTYKMPSSDFDSLFFIKNYYSPQNWYTKINELK